MSGKKKADAAPVVEEQPSEGGSYLRDPVTGALTRVEHPALDPTDPLHEANLASAEPAADAPDQPPAGGDTSHQEG